MSEKNIAFDSFRKQIIDDYKLMYTSRSISIMGRKEVLTGKGKFGIFGEGIELAQLAMSKVFRKGDFRTGYYRDQTFSLAIGSISCENIFSNLYAHTDLSKDSAHGGRQMVGHFATRFLDEDGEFVDLTKSYNSTSDISTTAGSIPRLLGLGLASKLYKNSKYLKTGFDKFSSSGNEVAFGTIGDASTSEGVFFEMINAAGVMQVPIVLSVWDNGYGISVERKTNTVKESISSALAGFKRSNNSNGWEIIKVKGWDYSELISAYEKADKIARQEHIPVLVHVDELTQPQGHSTSGSHERYKSKERLDWEKQYDCMTQFRKWMLNYSVELSGDKQIIISEKELLELENEVKLFVKKSRNNAWNDYQKEIVTSKKEVESLIKEIYIESNKKNKLNPVIKTLQNTNSPIKKDILSCVRKVLRIVSSEKLYSKDDLRKWLVDYNKIQTDNYSSHLYSQSAHSFDKIKPVEIKYSPESVDGRIILRDNFDKLLEKHPELCFFGEDSGKLGDVNQGLEGLQEKYGDMRVWDTSIREATIIGQGIGMAMRGLRPVAEIQYLDYIHYAYYVITDDLASLHYRTKGGQKAPLIIRTRGHRLEGVWHSGSPMGAILNGFKGVYILVPRNMTKAAGFYNSLMKCDNPALVIEPLNMYRNKEKLPVNMGEFTTQIGEVDFIREGKDVTVVTYGSMCKIVLEASEELSKMGIDIEIIDIQSLMPFDVKSKIVESIKKTSRVVVVDEDVPGGASSYIMKNILENQDAYHHIDSKPITITAKAHRPAYSTDGDYFSKPSSDDVIEGVYSIMNEFDPMKFPEI